MKFYRICFIIVLYFCNINEKMLFKMENWLFKNIYLKMQKLYLPFISFIWTYLIMNFRKKHSTFFIFSTLMPKRWLPEVKPEAKHVMNLPRQTAGNLNAALWIETMEIVEKENQGRKLWKGTTWCSASIALAIKFQTQIYLFSVSQTTTIGKMTKL